MAKLSTTRRALRALLKGTGCYPLCVISYCALQLMYCYWSQRRSRAGAGAVIVDHNFIQDVEALQHSSGAAGINLIRLPYEPIYAVAALFFDENIRDHSYLVPEMLQPRKRYARLLRLLFTLWRPERRIRAFIAPSDSFFWIREIIPLLQQREIPCIVVDKEGTISPHSMEHHSRQVMERYPFISDAIIVWSERQRQFWLRTGVDGALITVAGQPRSDFFLNSSVWRGREQFLCGFRHLVLFFSFETDAYAPVPGEHIWRPLRRDIHQALLAAARRHPDTLFVIKTHPQQLDRAEVEAEFSRSALDNVRVLSGPELSRHLIVHADLVLGFQTTALTEAMLAGKRVIYTEWSGPVRENLGHLIPFHEAGGIDIARSRGEFEELLAGIIERREFAVTPQAMAARRPFVETFIPNADGQVSRRVMCHIARVIGLPQPQANLQLSAAGQEGK